MQPVSIEMPPQLATYQCEIVERRGRSALSCCKRRCPCERHQGSSSMLSSIISALNGKCPWTGQR